MFQLTDEQANNLGVWIYALQSGNFEQTRHDLIRATVDPSRCKLEFCCLGVAAWILLPDRLSKEGLCRRKASDSYFVFQVVDNPSYIPEEIFEEMFGLSGVVQYHLALMNDEEKSFEVIAEVLKGYLVLSDRQFDYYDSRGRFEESVIQWKEIGGAEREGV